MLNCYICKRIIPIHLVHAVRCLICKKIVCYNHSYTLLERRSKPHKEKLVGRICKRHVTI